VNNSNIITRIQFVLSKALNAGLRPIVVLNKMDRDDRLRVDEVEEEVAQLCSFVFCSCICGFMCVRFYISV